MSRPVRPARLNIEIYGCLSSTAEQRGNMMQDLQNPTRFKAVKPYAVRLLSPAPAAALPQVDLRPRIRDLGLDIRSQGERDTCSVFAMTFLLEYMYVTRLTGVPNDLSEEYLNFVTDSVSGQRKDGDFFHNIDKGYSTWGIVPEAVVPYAASPVTTIAQPTLDRGRGWTRFRAQFLKTLRPQQASIDRSRWLAGAGGRQEETGPSRP
jgi:hypothetical protein